MLADAQAAGRRRRRRLHTIDAIRDYPGLEKARALQVLARRHEETGDAATSEGLMRRAVAVLEAKAPEKPLPGKVMTLNAFGRDTFIDFDLELEPGLRMSIADVMLQGIRSRGGEVEAAIREARAVPPPARRFRPVAARRQPGPQRRPRPRDGPRRVDRVPGARLQAFVTLAGAIPDRQAKK